MFYALYAVLCFSDVTARDNAREVELYMKELRDKEYREYHRKYYRENMKNYVSKRRVLLRLWKGSFDGEKPYISVHAPGTCVIYSYELTPLNIERTAFVCRHEIDMCSELTVPEGCKVHCDPSAVDTSSPDKSRKLTAAGKAVFSEGEKVYFTEFAEPGFIIYTSRDINLRS